MTVHKSKLVLTINKIEFILISIKNRAMANNAIIEFNKQLVKSDSRYDLLNYIKDINKLSDNPIDLSFMEELLNFVESNECCIPHTLLVNYGIIGDDKNISFNTKRLLEQYEFINDKDFKLLNVEELGNNGKHYNKKIYYLHPNTFKFILMRSKCENKYAKYYLLLERSIKYYHDYQIMYKEYLLGQKDAKIDEMSKKIDELINTNHEQSKKIDEQTKKIDDLLGHTIDIKDDLSTLIDVTTDTIEQNEIAQVLSKDRINIPKLKSNVECIAIIRNETDSKYKYKYIRGTYSYVKLTIGKLTGTKFARLSKSNKEPWLVTSTSNDYNFTFVYAWFEIPNARHLFRASKELIFDNSGVNFNFSKSELILISHIQDVFDGRLDVTLSDSDSEVVKIKSSNKVKEVKSKTKTLK